MTTVLNAAPITVMEADFLFPCDIDTMLPTGKHDPRAEQIATDVAQASGFNPTAPWVFTIGGVTIGPSEPELGVALYGEDECEVVARAVAGDVTVQFLMLD